MRAGSEARIEIAPFQPVFEDAVVDLIVGIQRGEFGIDITAEQQPDLRRIRSYYQRGDGNFWVALHDGRVVGTTALLDIGNRQCALRKMFVHAEHRGARTGTARHLLETLLVWSRKRGTRDIYLGTTPKFLAAHRFYEKTGFSEIARSELPPTFPIMEVDTRFYHLSLAP